MNFGFELSEAAPILLQSEHLPRTDANSPVHSHNGQVIAFMSHYVPLGHSYRRIGPALEKLEGPLERVHLLNNPDPAVGKWIESTWRSPSGRLYGWYHAEELAPCEQRLFLPHIGALVSDNDGLDWHCLGEVLRPSSSLIDCSYKSGFFAGGYGDFSVISDRQAAYLYIHFSSYVSDENAQGISVARYQVASCDRPADTLQVWRNGTWHPVGDGLASPVHRPARGWKYADPDGFWGPAVHFNRSINAYVMLLNRTRNGNSNLVQEGVYVSFNEHLENPDGWTPPVQMIKGGVWYPEAIGLDPGDGDTVAGAPARFFMSGFSAWTVRFSRNVAQTQPRPPITIGLEDWIRLFGAAAPSRLGIG